MAASFKHAVAWIAMNDEPTCMDATEIAGLVSVCLVADIFGKENEYVAKKILKYREFTRAKGE